MTSHPKPLDFRICFENSKPLKNLEISYPIDSNFLLGEIFSKFNSIIDTFSSRKKGEALAELNSIRKNPVVQICEYEYDDSKTKIIEKEKNEPFIADINNLKVFWESDRCFMKNQGRKVIELFEGRKYLMKIRQRARESQLKDLLFSISWDDVKTGKIPFNFYVQNEVLSNSIITDDFEELMEFVSPENVADGIMELLIDEKYVEISHQGLLNGTIQLTNNEGSSSESLSFMNYMTFKIAKSKKLPLPNDKALSISFDAVLKSKGVTEKDRLKSCITMVNRVRKASTKYFYTPFLNVCQSSGSGKTKIATELMHEMPSFYAVFREEVRDPETMEMIQFGYPYMSRVSELLLSVSLDLPNETSDEASASSSIVGTYLLILKAIFSDYLDALKNGSSFLDISKKILDGTFIGHDLALGIAKTWKGFYLNKSTHKFQESQNSESAPISIKNVVASCLFFLESIDVFRHNPVDPFVLIVDEASLMCTKCSKTGINLFRLFRRAVNMLGSDCNFVALTLGTNSDILDLNPDLSVDSFRDSAIGRTFPPFLLSRNWDVFLDYEELKKRPIGYNQMLNGRMIIFWASLGRPLWAAVSFRRLMNFVRVKICNKSLESGEAFLAFWMVRVGLLVNSTHVVSQHLVKSLMGTLLYVSSNLRSMRVYYPSEPIMAVEIRSLLLEADYIEKYYAALEKFIKNRAIDTGKFSEVISADICLLAIARSERSQCTWKFNESLPQICGANRFVFEKSQSRSENENNDQNVINETETKEIYNQNVTNETETKESDNQNVFKETETKDSDNQKVHIDEEIRQHFGSAYIVAEGIKFVRSLYDLNESKNENIATLINRFVPELMKSALLNMSHYTQISTKFPFGALEKGFKDDLKMTVPPLADPQYSKTDDLCNQITYEVLETMIMRGSGIMLAPNTYGLDHVIPVCMKPTTGIPCTRPEYSFIGVQVKRGSGTSIRKIVSKGAVSNHYVRCGLSGNVGCKCSNNTCEFRVPDDQYKRILENGLMLIHSMTDDESYYKGSRDEDDDDDDDEEEEEELEQVPKHPKLDPNSNSHIFKCETSLPGSKELYLELQLLRKKLKEKKIASEQFIVEKEAIEKQLRDLVKDLCPKEFIDKLDEFKVVGFGKYDGCRFIPDVYIQVRASKGLSVHCMIKKRSEGINEKIVAIHTKGLEAFSSKVLPNKSKEIARRIISYDRSVFDEIDYDQNTKPPIKFTELITGVVARNNCSSIPIANNYIRSKYGLPEIPDHVPDYQDVNNENMDNL